METKQIEAAIALAETMIMRAKGHLLARQVKSNVRHHKTSRLLLAAATDLTAQIMKMKHYRG